MGSPPLILIADRRVDERELYGEYFAWAGFRVELATTGDEAFSKAVNCQPAVIVTGFALHELSGYDLCRCLKGEPSTRHIPVIMLTARPFETDMRTAQDAGPDRLLLKPCLPSDLLVEVQRLVPRGPRKRLASPRKKAVAALKATQERRHTKTRERRRDYIARNWRRFASAIEKI